MATKVYCLVFCMRNAIKTGIPEFFCGLKFVIDILVDMELVWFQYTATL